MAQPSLGARKDRKDGRRGAQYDLGARYAGLDMFVRIIEDTENNGMHKAGMLRPAFPLKLFDRLIARTSEVVLKLLAAIIVADFAENGAVFGVPFLELVRRSKPSIGKD
ncbi:hypothetical protein MKZ38_001503 [Zalerion maritima]|uniref:Uncharacterized protein n=1 Tax=Zalerion maritima TaxID=339359 RepID=A0AAD5WTT4_9PEZI|nr:hypothetical protein MKZ38_001503 [Zalerion maritima]